MNRHPRAFHLESGLSSASFRSTCRPWRRRPMHRTRRSLEDKQGQPVEERPFAAGISAFQRPAHGHHRGVLNLGPGAGGPTGYELRGGDRPVREDFTRTAGHGQAGLTLRC
jgi:hypothetical protein